MSKKVTFIAHPLRGDVRGNMQKILRICEQVHREGSIPVAPYLVSLQYLDDGIIEDRTLGIEANIVCFKRKFIDRVWLYGDRISEGMRGEIHLAHDLNIPVFAKTPETAIALKRLYPNEYP